MAMAMNFTWVQWDIKARGVRRETRSHNSRENNRRRGLPRTRPLRDVRSSQNFPEQYEAGRRDRVVAKPEARIQPCSSRPSVQQHPDPAPSISWSTSLETRAQRHFSSEASEFTGRALPVVSPRTHNESALALFDPSPELFSTSEYSEQINLIAGRHFSNRSQNQDDAKTSPSCSSYPSHPSARFIRTSDSKSSDSPRLRRNKTYLLDPKPLQYMASPQDPLTSFRRDSFSSLPFRLDRDHDLLDYWIMELPRIFQIGSNPSLQRILLSMQSSLLRDALSSTEAFKSTVLLFAVYHSGRIHVVEYAQRATELRSQILQWLAVITDLSKDITDFREEDGIGILSSVNAECLYGDQHTALQFFDRGRHWFRRWRLTGNMWESCHNIPLKTLFWWYRVLNCGSECAMKNFITAGSNQQLQDDFVTFWRFVEDSRELALRQCVSTGNSSTLSRTNVFQHGGLLSVRLQAHKIAASGARPRQEIYCTFLVLAFIHAALLENQDSVTNTEIYLSKLVQHTAKLDISADESPVYSLLWSFQQEPLLNQFTTLAQVSAASQIALRITDTGLSLLNSILLEYLELTERTLPYLEKTLFRGMVFNPDDWKFMDFLNHEALT